MERKSNEVKCTNKTTTKKTAGRKKGVDDTKISDIVERVQEIARFFKNSPKASRILHDQQRIASLKPMPLKLNNKTRWGSALGMFCRLAKSRAAVSSALAILHEDRTRTATPPDLTSEEWVMVNELIAILQPLQTATEIVSCQQQPTFGSVLAALHGFVYNKLLPDQNDSAIARKFKADLRQGILDSLLANLRTYCNSAILIATSLDPRMKVYTLPISLFCLQHPALSLSIGSRKYGHPDNQPCVPW